jgi:MFS family permease
MRAASAPEGEPGNRAQPGIMAAGSAPDAVSRRSTRALDLLNFSLADVRDGLGPYLSIYLLVTQHWDQASIGFVMAVGGIASIAAQTPFGALVDRTTAKRALIVAGAVLVTAGTLAIPLFPGFSTITVLQVVTGAAGSVFAPALAATTLGIVGSRRFARRIGRNESFNHAGNASAAAVTGGLGYFFGPVVVFWVLAAMAAFSVAATLRIPRDAIDDDVARGLDQTVRACAQDLRRPSGPMMLLRNRPLLIFTAAMVTFHFANAAMLPLVGQVLALHNKAVGTSLMAACVAGAQVVMVPVAFLAGAKADSWGRKPIFLVAFAVLTARGFLYTLSDNPGWLIGVQLLDGVGAGIFGALFPLVVQDLTHGTGRFNMSLGAVTTVWGVGASLSNFVAGSIVLAAGYDAAFRSLGAVAAAGLLLYLIAMPETADGTAAAPQQTLAEVPPPATEIAAPER